MLIIGELINSTRKQVRKAVEEQDAAFIQGLARKQVEAGATWIDVNAGAFPNDEVEKMKWLITVIRQVTDAPLSIDSPRSAAVEAGLAMAGREPLLNSISAESDRYTALIPLVKKFNTHVVALSLDDSGMTDDMQKVWQVADGLIKRLEDDGVPPDHIFVDPLIRPVSTNGEYGMGALWVVEKITSAHPQVHKTCGLSNVSYGLPEAEAGEPGFCRHGHCQGHGFGHHRSAGPADDGEHRRGGGACGKGPVLHGVHHCGAGGKARRHGLNPARCRIGRPEPV